MADEMSKKCVAHWALMKKNRPLIMCVTNKVTPQRMADVLLAAGASPAMIDSPQEIAQFAGITDITGGGVYLNTGLHAAQVDALPALTAWRQGSANSVLVVDPVGYGATPFRNATIDKVLDDCRPEVIKGNASEILALSGAQADGKGVDAGSTKPEDPVCVQGARAVAAKYGCVVTITGPSDVVVEAGPSGRVAIIRDGDGSEADKGRMMTLVTGTGCSLGALITATVAASRDDPFAATVAACAAFTLAARRALAISRGPGSLSTNLLDELYLLAPEDLASVEIIVS